MALHLIDNSTTPAGLELALACVQAGDAVVILQWPNEGGADLTQRLSTLAEAGIGAYALDNGMTPLPSSLPETVSVVDYEGWAGLCEQHPAIQSWFD